MSCRFWVTRSKTQSKPIPGLWPAPGRAQWLLRPPGGGLEALGKVGGDRPLLLLVITIELLSRVSRYHKIADRLFKKTVLG